MIHRLLRSVATAFPDLRVDQLMDALWLAARYRIDTIPPSPAPESDVDRHDVGEVEESALGLLGISIGVDLALSDEGQRPPETSFTEVGLQVSSSAELALNGVAALSRFRRVHRLGPPTVDIDATVEATADARRLVVVTRPTRERGLDVALVVERTPVAKVWEDTIAAFEATLRRTGVFRSVTRWSLEGTDEESVVNLVLRNSAGTAHTTDTIIDPAGRRLVLIMTDSTAPQWHMTDVWHMIKRWAHVMPTAVVHLLPRSYWGYTAIGQPTAAMRSRRVAAPNSESEVTTAWWGDAPTHTEVAVPVVAMRAEDIGRWVSAVLADGAWIDSVWVRPLTRTAILPGSELTAADRVRAFESRASVGAQELARVLASASVLSLPLIRMLHTHLVRSPKTEQLAELLVSGLLEKMPDSALLRFRRGVADLLYRGTTASQEWDLNDVITRHLAQNARSGKAVRVVLANPRGTVAVEGGLAPFATLGRALAGRLGISVPVSSDGFQHVQASQYTVGPILLEEPIDFYRLAERSPDDLLYPTSRYFPFLGRADEIAALSRWRGSSKGDPSVAVGLVRAPLDWGKSRLAIEFARISNRDGWDVLAANPQPPSYRGKDGLVNAPFLRRATLLVVDDIQLWSTASISALMQEWVRVKPLYPIRVLLISDTVSEVMAIRDDAVEVHDLPPVAGTPSLRMEYFRRICTSLARYYELDESEVNVLVGSSNLDDSTYDSIGEIIYYAISGFEAFISGRALRVEASAPPLGYKAYPL